ncbi:M48 family metalloprotease, partial [Nostoc sp. HG1]|nr:M48 family metalloprotease [Nostoc sp. HG1]
MLKLFSLPDRGRRWFYPVLSIFVALGITVSSMPSQAISVFDLLRQGVQIIQLSNISARQEVEIGKQIDQQIKREVRIYRNQDINSYVQQIGRQLAATSDRPNLPYTFQVVDDKGVNAFATAGGFVYVNTGLLKLA